MHAKITIQMDSAAFDDLPATELARILRDLAKHVEAGDTDRRLMDTNGNTVGRFEIHEDGDPVINPLEEISALLGSPADCETDKETQILKTVRDALKL